MNRYVHACLLMLNFGLPLSLWHCMVVVHGWSLPPTRPPSSLSLSSSQILPLSSKTCSLEETRRGWFKSVGASLGLMVGTTVATPGDATAKETRHESFLPTSLGVLPSNDINPPFKGKTVGLSLEELAQRLTKDLTIGATEEKGGYFLTGDLSRDIFRDDCIFIDPTTSVNTLDKYQNALRILFDPSSSTIQLLAPGLKVHPDTRTITGRLRSRGYLQLLPWRPYVSAYETEIEYSVDENGLIYSQYQEWPSKTASRAIQETFTPSILTPPKSTRSPSTSEPAQVTRLFDYINGRRPNEYTQEERFEISDLIESIVVMAAAPSAPISSSQQAQEKSSATRISQTSATLRGSWALAYLQPGPNGEGIDRRIPFPEFGFNDNFQIFTKETVLNVGQLIGPWVDVRVAGTLQEEDPSIAAFPKRYQANIDGGKLCILGKTENNCIELPIRGEGLFDSLYVGERLRIGQNINGGGARVIQIRLDDDFILP